MDSGAPVDRNQSVTRHAGIGELSQLSGGGALTVRGRLLVRHGVTSGLDKSIKLQPEDPVGFVKVFASADLTLRNHP